MVRERIKELVDFATTESPYRNATKGWLTDDVFISWGASDTKVANQTNELANVSVYWKPFSRLVSIIFVVFFLASIFVFSAVSFAHGRFQIPSGLINEAPLTNSVDSEEIAPIQSVSQPVISKKLDVQPVIEGKPEVALEIENKKEFAILKSRSEFAAAALGGKKVTR